MAGWLIATTIAVAGCASGPLKIETGEGSVQTFDGLYPVSGTRRGTEVWVLDDFDLAPYDKILLEGAGISYRPVKEGPRTSAGVSSTGAFPISEKSRAMIRDVFSEEFAKVLGQQTRFEVVTQPGPDVLRVRGALLDVVSRVPPDRVGRSEIYLSSVGEATLVIELRDSETDTPLLRAVERRRADRNDRPIWSNPVANMNEVRRLANSWARRLSESLDYLAESQGIASR
ncbi:MAG: DUF3313 family protein [Pseudomonadales bacterium]|nr:DUF3313 family protein [Pseudomonadales bacterium]